MCRLFGFRSVLKSQVHRSLVAAENALAVQSRKHSDGWGVAYYIADSPHVIKSVMPAAKDSIFERVSGVVASETVLAHLRKATVGSVNILNAHPFQHGRWVFAHNGEVRNFDEHRAAIRAEVAVPLRRYILGDTDSETLFYLFLSHLGQLTDFHRRGTPVDLVVDALRKVIETTRALADRGDAEADRCLLTFVVTDGHTLVGISSGKPLVYSTHKSHCEDRDSCPFLADVCEAPTTTGKVNHLLVSSEELSGSNVWTELGSDHWVGVDWGMNFTSGSIRN
jgi:glutamine amidotransferase